MKKKYFYLLGAACVVGTSLILLACGPCELLADESKEYACYCKFDGKNKEYYTHEFVKKKKFVNCEDLEEWLEKQEPEHEIDCRTSDK